MKSIKELNLDEKILSYLNPEKLDGQTLPYEVTKLLIEDEEIAELQNYANHVSIVRLGYNDHGPVHMKTVTRNCIKMMKILHDAQIKTNLEKENTDLRNLEKEKGSERERISGELARLEERKATMLNEFEEYNAKLYDEYQLTRREAIALEIVIENIGDARTRLSALKNEIRGLGSVNVSAIDEYKEVSERYNFLSEQINDVEASRAQLHKLINQLTGKMQTLFVNRFNEINKHFSIVFAELFGGGKAD